MWTRSFPGPAWANTTGPCPLWHPLLLGILVIVKPQSCLALRLVWTSNSHCSTVSAAARWILDMSHHLASSGTVGGSCHCHQPTPAQTLCNSTHCRGKTKPELQRHQGLTTLCKEHSSPVGIKMRMSLPLHLVLLDSSDFPGWGSVQLGTACLKPAWYSPSAGLSFEQEELW